MPSVIKLVVILCIAGAIPVHAQRGLQQSAQAIRHTTRTAGILNEHVLNTAQHIAVAPAIAPAIPLMPPMIPVEPARIYETFPVTPKERSWIEQKRRDIKAWQLKRQHAQLVALRQQLAALPKLQVEYSFHATDLTPYRVENATPQNIPTIPALSRPDYLYRGLGLSASGQEIRNIFQNGLRLCDVGKNSNCLLLALSHNAHNAATVSSIKYTNLARRPALALDYALRNARYIENGVAAIVIVKGVEGDTEVVQATQDIPNSNIEGILVLLNIENKQTWCLVQLQDEHFVITPYETGK